MKTFSTLLIMAFLALISPIFTIAQIHTKLTLESQISESGFYNSPTIEVVENVESFNTAKLLEKDIKNGNEVLIYDISKLQTLSLIL